MDSLDQEADAPKDPPRWRAPLLLAAKLAIAAVVIVAAWGAVRDAWDELASRGLTFDCGLALASGVALIVGLAPMAWYWRRTLEALGEPAPLWPSMAAYYISQIGKYAPGKGMVVIVRVQQMLAHGGRGRTIAACVFYETLTLMAAGAVLSALLIWTELPEETPSRRLLIWLSVGFAVGCFLPTTPPVARWLIGRLAPPREASEGEVLRGITPLLALEGWIASLASWFGLGVSTWLAAWSVGASDWDDYRLASLWVLAAALPVVGGFVSLLPAGILVREGLILTLLSRHLGEPGALATAIAVRLIWVVSECVFCAIVFACSRRAE